MVPQIFYRAKNNLSSLLAWTASLLVHFVLLGSIWWGKPSDLPVGESLDQFGVEISLINSATSPSKSKSNQFIYPNKSNQRAAKPMTSKVIAQAETADLAEAESTKDQQAGESPQLEQQNSAAARFGTKDGRVVSEKDRYLAALRAYINQNKVYPAMAKKLREQGEVLIEFKVRKDGIFYDARVIREAQSPRLNMAALDLVRKTGGFSELPKSLQKNLSENESLTVRLPVEYIHQAY